MPTVRSTPGRDERVCAAAASWHCRWKKAGLKTAASEGKTACFHHGLKLESLVGEASSTSSVTCNLAPREVYPSRIENNARSKYDETKTIVLRMECSVLVAVVRSMYFFSLNQEHGALL